MNIKITGADSRVDEDLKYSNTDAVCNDIWIWTFRRSCIVLPVACLRTTLKIITETSLELP
jgi:hypothetical protein